jgi:hypothetical protein
MKKGDSVSKRGKNLDFTTAPYSTVMRMYSDFRDQAADVYGQMDGTALNMAIAYEDFAAGLHAMRTFQGLFDDGQRQLQFNMRNAWKFDFLRITELREAAITETVRADLIIVSVHAAKELPATVKWWIETAVERREGDPGALVLLYDRHRRNGSKRPPSAEAYLTELAERAGLDFFARGASTESMRPTPEENSDEPVAVRGRSRRRPAGLACNKRRFSLAFWE